MNNFLRYFPPTLVLAVGLLLGIVAGVLFAALEGKP